MRWIAPLLLAVLLSVCGGLYVAWNHVLDALQEPLGFDAGRVEFKIPEGASLKHVLTRLEREGICRQTQWLYVYARIKKQVDIKAGYYEILSTDTPLQMLERFLKGKVLLFSVVIPEGYNRWQVRRVLTEAGWMSEADFEALCENKTFLESQGLTTPTCEGALFPNTYAFAKNTSPRDIFKAMFGLYKNTLQDIQKTYGRGPLQWDDNAMTTLASVVEKETGYPEERPHIACVFYNRLTAQPPWRLETDPTVAYAATLADPSFNGNIKKWHLTSLMHPYNTYKYTGLPPGPIANPGREALLAVAQPAPCKDYFFVSMNNGQHVFCPDLKCHNKAVNYWQKMYFGVKKTTE
jgi:UPF0755 protein